MAINVTAERNKWFIQKDAITEEAKQAHGNAITDYAARGFSIPPGPLERALRDLGVATRKAMSAANMKIVEEQVGVELDELQHSYTIALEVARLAMEVERQALIIALNLEMAQLAKALTVEEEALIRLGLEIDRRSAALSAARVTLELELGDLQKELDAVDRRTFDAERLLIAERLVTIQTRLTMIPELENLIAAEQSLIQQIRINTGWEESRIAKTNELISAKNSLLPYLWDVANAKTRLAQAETARVSVEESRLTLANQRAGLEYQRTNADTAITNAEIEMDKSRLALDALKQNLQQYQVAARAELTTVKSVVEHNIANEKAYVTAVEVERIKTAIEAVRRNIRTQVQAIDLAAKQTCATSRVASQQNMITQTASEQAYGITQSAHITADARVTAQLIHAIGS